MSQQHQLKPRLLLVGDSILHNTNFNIIERVTNSTIKTSKAYSAAWDNGARFKHQNVTAVVKNELEKAPFDHLVLSAPTVDITNLDTSSAKSEDPTDVFKKKVELSCKNMMKVAENALTNHSSLKKVTIMNHAPRFDQEHVDPLGLKPKLATYANSFLLELWLDSPQKQNIHIGSHYLQCSANTMTDERSGKYDGVHLYGSAGKQAYTESVINILLSSVNPSANDDFTRMLPNDDFHTRCPQTKYNQKQKKLYSNVVGGKGPIKTQNRFSPLAGNSKN